MRTHMIAALVAALSLAACGTKADEADATADAAAAGSAPAASAPSEAARAAAMSNAIAAAPTKSDSILTANGLTVVQLEAMMIRIARDSSASAEYARLTAR